MAASLNRRERVALRRALNVSHSFDYLRELETGQLPQSGSMESLRKLSVRHTVLHQLSVSGMRCDLSRKSLDANRARSIIGTAARLDGMRKKEADDILNNIGVKITSIADPRPESLPRKTKPARRESDPTPNPHLVEPIDQFDAFCHSAHLIEKVDPPAIRIRAQSSIGPTPGRQASTPRQPPVLIAPSSPRRQVFIHRIKVGANEVIDLDKSDFMDYIEEAVLVDE
jgi:hypothetical protein